MLQLGERESVVGNLAALAFGTGPLFRQPRVIRPPAESTLTVRQDGVIGVYPGNSTTKALTSPTDMKLQKRHSPWLATNCFLLTNKVSPDIL